mgnify:CR=1 FL=1
MLFGRIIEIFKSQRLIIENFGYLTLLNIYNLFLPLLIYPYLIRVLGTETYGLVIFVQTIIAYFSIFINLGFNISATKEIAIYHNNKRKLSEIISSVLIITSTIWLVFFFFLLLLTFTIPVFKENKILFIIGYGATFNDFLFITSYFQGLQRMKYITIINAVTRTIYLMLVFLIVKTSKEYLYVILLNSIMFLINGLICIYIIFFKDGIKFKIQPYNILRNYIIKTLPIFYFNLFGSIKSKSNEIFLGFATTYTSVTAYNLSSKITFLSTSIFANLSNAIYPNISISKNINQGKKYLLFIMFTSLIFYLMIVLFAKHIIALLAGANTFSSYNILYIVGASIPLYSTSTAIGQILLLPNGLNREFSFGTVISTVVYLILVGFQFYFDAVNIYSLSYDLLISNLISVLIRLYYAYKNYLL